MKQEVSRSEQGPLGTRPEACDGASPGTSWPQVLVFSLPEPQFPHLSGRNNLPEVTGKALFLFSAWSKSVFLPLVSHPNRTNGALTLSVSLAAALL